MPEIEEKSVSLNSALADNCHEDPFQQDDSLLPLPQLIPLIIAQRGSFTNVTEQGLMEEIDNQTAGSSAATPSSESAGNNDLAEEDSATAQEEFMKAKQEALTLVRSALNESHLSLDFVSLLISCLRPAAGTTSMSPHLKQFVKVGSLNSDKIIPEDDSGHMEKVTRVGQGWKLESLTRASASLRSASTRLSEEVLKERKYWGDIVEILKYREVLTKANSSGGTSGNTKEFGVKYGFGDAGSTYFDKGVGLLKKNSTYGNVVFKPVTNERMERTYKVVTVRVLGKVDDQFVVLGKSDTNSKGFKPKTSGIPVLSEIEKARFYLFEEELFYQLLKEAASLISTNVQVDSNKIVVNLHNEVLEIEAVAPEEDQEEDEEDEAMDEEPKTEHDRRAEMIALFLRLMLCAHHKRNREKKRQPPKSLQQLTPEQHQAQQQEKVSLLRPFIGFYKHNEYVSELDGIMRDTVKKAFDSRAEEILKGKYSILRNHEEADKSSDPFRRCLTPPKTDFELLLPLTEGSLKVVVSLSGTEAFCDLAAKTEIYRVKHTSEDSEDDYELLLDLNFNDLRDLQDCLSWAVPRYVE